MIIVVLVLAIALLVAAGVLFLTEGARRRAVGTVRRMRTERDERASQAESERDTAIAERDAAVSERNDAVARADKLATETAAPGAPTPPSNGQGPALQALWALALLRTDWSRRRAGGLSTAPEGGGEPDPLTRVLTSEVEQLRDDAGIPGNLQVALSPPASAEEAVLVAASTSALLAALTRWCDAYDLFLHRWEGRVAAVMVCEGFDGPDTVADETSELLAALAPAKGDLDVDRDAEGRLRARLSLPTSTTSG